MKKKKCPFRKRQYMVDYKIYGSGYPLAEYEESFCECIGSECMAWTRDTDVDDHYYIYCALMKGNSK